MLILMQQGCAPAVPCCPYAQFPLLPRTFLLFPKVPDEYNPYNPQISKVDMWLCPF